MLPHFEVALESNRDESKRSFLIQSQVKQLRRLAQDMSEYSRKHAANLRSEMTRAERTAADTVVEKFASVGGQQPKLKIPTQAGR